MTALLGMGREGMISVSSSIWSVPLAGWLCEKRCSNIRVQHTSYMAYTHTLACIHPKIIPVSPSSSFFSDSGPRHSPSDCQYLVRALSGAVLAIKIEHLLMGWMWVSAAVCLHSGQVDFFFHLQHVQYFKGNWGIQFRQLRGHAVTFHKVWLNCSCGWQLIFWIGNEWGIWAARLIGSKAGQAVGNWTSENSSSFSCSRT